MFTPGPLTERSGNRNKERIPCCTKYFVVHYRTGCTVQYTPHRGRHGDPHRQPLSSGHRTCYMDNRPCTSGTSYTDDATDGTFKSTRNTSNPQTPQGIVPPLTPPPRPRTARYNPVRQSATPPGSLVPYGPLFAPPATLNAAACVASPARVSSNKSSSYQFLLSNPIR